MRISPRWIIALSALGFGALAAFGTHHTIADRLAALDARSRQNVFVKQVVATQDLARGTRLNADTVSVRSIPKEWAYADALTPEQIDRFENAALDVPARQGQPILWQQLTPARPPSLSDRIERGRRALTVPVDEVSSLSGMVMPGDRIDLLVAIRQATKATLLPLLQNALVLATGSHSDPREASGPTSEPRSFNTLTLDVSPENARKIFAAREIGRLTAVLRAPADEENVRMGSSDALRILGLAGDSPNSSAIQVIYADRLNAPMTRRFAASFP